MLNKDISKQLNLQPGQFINCNQRFSSMWYTHSKGYIEDIDANGVWLSNGKDHDEQCLIDIERYPDIYIMDKIETLIFRELGV